MTAPLPPVDGPITPAEQQVAAQGYGTPMEIIAPHPDLSGITAQAVAAGEAWNAGGAQWADSPQGDGLGGYTLAGDKPSGADGTWNTDMSFEHQGP